MASIFTRIINSEIKGEIVHQDEHCAVLKDIHPQAPVHLLVVPKKEIQSVDTARLEDQLLLGHLLLTAAQVAREQGFDETGYRVVINYGKDGGMTVPHLHLHVLAGRKLTWPPG
jgi:histidine triad (HIT) family protein